MISKWQTRGNLGETQRAFDVFDINLVVAENCVKQWTSRAWRSAALDQQVTRSASPCRHGNQWQATACTRWKFPESPQKARSDPRGKAGATLWATTCEIETLSKTTMASQIRLELACSYSSDKLGTRSSQLQEGVWPTPNCLQSVNFNISCKAKCQ